MWSSNLVQMAISRTSVQKALELAFNSNTSCCQPLHVAMQIKYVSQNNCTCTHTRNLITVNIKIFKLTIITLIYNYNCLEHSVWQTDTTARQRRHQNMYTREHHKDDVGEGSSVCAYWGTSYLRAVLPPDFNTRGSFLWYCTRSTTVSNGFEEKNKMR